MPNPSSTVAGQTFGWGRYIFVGGSHVLAKDVLFRKYQAIYDPALVWVRGRVTVNEAPSPNATLITSGVVNADAIADSSSLFINGSALGAAIGSGQGVTLGQAIVLSEGIVLSESIVLSEGIVLSEAIVLSESIVLSEAIVLSEGIGIGEAIVLSESSNLGEP